MTFPISVVTDCMFLSAKQNGKDILSSHRLFLNGEDGSDANTIDETTVMSPPRYFATLGVSLGVYVNQHRYYEMIIEIL